MKSTLARSPEATTSYSLGACFPAGPCRRALQTAWLLVATLLLTACDNAPSGQAGGGTPSGHATAPAPVPVPVNLVWPTPNPAYFQNAPFEAFIQPTASGETSSGLYGSTRNGGRRFHEGLDLYPLSRDARGEALDPVFAALPGVVTHASARAGASGYGIYVVMEHPDETPAVYTLYAHLESIAPGVMPGARLPAGATLGRMGRSAGGYTIPRERAHLHFEIGLRLASADHFQAWYNASRFGSRNEHGAYNGMNLLGLDPLLFYDRARAGRLFSLAKVFADQPTAVTVRAARREKPEFVTRHPALATTSSDSLRGGWEVDFDHAGAPVRWRELALAEVAGLRAGELRVVFTDQTKLAANPARDLVRMERGAPAPGRDLRSVLDLLFP